MPFGWESRNGLGHTKRWSNSMHLRTADRVSFTGDELRAETGDLVVIAANLEGVEVVGQPAAERGACDGGLSSEFDPRPFPAEDETRFAATDRSE